MLWSPEHRCWHIPRRARAWEYFRKLFPDDNIIVPKNVAFFRQEAADSPSPELKKRAPGDVGPTSETKGDRIIVSRHPKDNTRVRIHIPVSMLADYVPVIKNIHGRRWNPDSKVWEAPLTKVTVRFVEKFLPGVAHWTFQVVDDIPERVEIPRPAKKSAPKFTPARYENAVSKLEETLLLKRYSWNTIKAYLSCFRYFLRFYDRSGYKNI